MKVNNKSMDEGIEIWNDFIISIHEVTMIGGKADAVLNLVRLAEHHLE